MLIKIVIITIFHDAKFIGNTQKDFPNIPCVKFSKRLNRLSNNHKTVNETSRDICPRLHLHLPSTGTDILKININLP